MTSLLATQSARKRKVFVSNPGGSHRPIPSRTMAFQQHASALPLTDTNSTFLPHLICTPTSNGPRAQMAKGKENRPGGLVANNPCHHFCLPSPIDNRKGLELRPSACQLSDPTLSVFKGDDQEEEEDDQQNEHLYLYQVLW